MKNGFKRYQLADRVEEALDKIGFLTPTPVQHQVIPLMLQRRNVIVEAATGTGKTAAYGLPLITRIDLLKRTTQVLVLVPSRELALQVVTALRTFTTHEKFRAEAVYGGMSLEDSKAKIKSAPHILVAVPGRLKDLLRTGKFDHFWRDIKYLVVDEADKLFEFGFQETLDNIVSNVRNMVQVAFFSATISEDAEELIRERFYPLQTIRLSPQEALKNIRFTSIFVDKGQKPRYLAGVLKSYKVKQALIFCIKREEVQEVANFLRSVGRKAEAYHGLLDQVERAAIMKRFKSKQIEFLVATDLAARGLDIEKLPAVINFSFPDDIEIYLHRCGRTGRAGEKGRVFNLTSSNKEEIIVRSFHESFTIGYKTVQVKPIGKMDMKGEGEGGRLVKVHLNRGKRDKIGAGDVVGFLTQTTGVPADQIGTIAVYDSYILVDLEASVFRQLGDAEEHKIKGKKVKATKYSLADQKRKAESVKKSKIGARDKKTLEKIRQKKARENEEVVEEVEKEPTKAEKKKSAKPLEKVRKEKWRKDYGAGRGRSTPSPRSPRKKKS